MAGKIKYGKIFVVVFITILIWIYADLALEETFDISDVPLIISRPADTRLWVTFQDDNSSTGIIDEVTISGPAAMMADFRQAYSKGNVALEVYIVPSNQGITEAGIYPLEVVPLVQENEEIRTWGLRVESAEPKTITVTAEELVRKALNVRCLDENDNMLTSQSVEPDQIQMWVPEDQAPVALVRLTEEEIRQARNFPVEKTPFIRLNGEQWNARETVDVLMPPDTLNVALIRNAKLGITYSLNMQGAYEVVIEEQDLRNIIGPISVSATPEAKQKYENQRYHVILELDDSLIGQDPETIIQRELIYNFPKEHVRRGEIELAQAPVIAKFRLVPVASEPETSTVEQ